MFYYERAINLFLLTSAQSSDENVLFVGAALLMIDIAYNTPEFPL
jgi:hypothetical protein